MNAMREFMTPIENYESSEKNSALTVLKDDKREEKNPNKDFLEENLYYFYNHGGPNMGI